eukprot:1888297-Rhodomonas_salina.1
MNILRCFQLTRRSRARCSATPGQDTDEGKGREVAGGQAGTATVSGVCCRCVEPVEVGREEVAR